jgi:hypothetical protein
MDITVVTPFVFLAAALFIGTRRSGLNIDNRIEDAVDPASPEDVVEDFYTALLETEISAKEEAQLKKNLSPSAHLQDVSHKWTWPVIAPDNYRPRGILVENASVDGNRAIVPVRAGYMNPSGGMDLRWKFGVLMEKIDGHWQIAGMYNK